MPKTVKMDILFRAARRRKTKGSRTTRSASPITSRQPTRTFPFKPPPGLGLKPVEADILLFIKDHPGADYDTWPEPMRISRVVERLKKDKLIRLKYYPTRYFLTREGSGLVAWIKSLSECRTANTTES